MYCTVKRGGGILRLEEWLDRDLNCSVTSDLGGILSLIWYVLVGLRPYRLGHFEGKVLVQG